MSTCDDLKCDDAELVDRDLKTETRKLRIHVGRMASGDSHMVSHHHRDKLAKEWDVLGFEMEGMGAWGPKTLVIKGVCDYADEHTNKRWQKHAAAAAAACTKALLEEWGCLQGTGGSRTNMASKSESNVGNGKPAMQIPMSRVTSSSTKESSSTPRHNPSQITYSHAKHF